MIKSCMPREKYGTLYKMDNMAEVITFCKDAYAIMPAEQPRKPLRLTLLEMHQTLSPQWRPRATQPCSAPEQTHWNPGQDWLQTKSLQTPNLQPRKRVQPWRKRPAQGMGPRALIWKSGTPRRILAPWWLLREIVWRKIWQVPNKKEPQSELQDQGCQ